MGKSVGKPRQSPRRADKRPVGAIGAICAECFQISLVNERAVTLLTSNTGVVAPEAQALKWLSAPQLIMENAEIIDFFQENRSRM